jgi:hypothetical protein
LADLLTATALLPANPVMNLEAALLLGAGFSKWAANVPVAAELFDFTLSASVTDQRKLIVVQRAKDAWDATHPTRYAEEFVAHVLSTGSLRERDCLSWYITRRLSEPFIWYQQRKRRTLQIDEPYKDSLPGVSVARQFLNTLPLDQLSGIVTTNYDLLVEYALGSRRFNYGEAGEALIGPGAHPRRPGPVFLQGTVTLAKLHGSISWDRQLRYTDGRRGVTGNALIVAPRPEKTPPCELAPVWKAATAILQRARRLVVFGFSFHPNDQEVRELLRGAGCQLREVHVIDPSPPLDRVAAIWPNASITSAPPPAGGWVGGLLDRET